MAGLKSTCWSRRSLLKTLSAVTAGALVSSSARAGGTGPVTGPGDMSAGPRGLESFRFGFDALDALAATGARQGTLALSPASLMQALALVDLGASPRLHGALLKLLRLDPHDRDAMLRLRGSLAPLFRQVSPGSAATGVAAVYVNETTTLRASAQAAFRSEGALLESCRLSDPATIRRINAMVETHTNGLIGSILPDKPAGNPGMILVNAFAFKDAWQYPFEASDTTDEDFFTRTGKIRVRMMHLTGVLDTAVAGPFAAVRLPYADGRYSLILLGRGGAPAGLTDFAPAAHLLTGEGFKARPVSISVPRVRLEAGADLIGALDSMGLSPAREEPDSLIGFSDQALQIGQVLHRTTIDIDEVGTVAAASTAMSMGVTSAPPLPNALSFVADRPFLFALRDDRADLCLMMGYVGHPG